MAVLTDGLFAGAATSGLAGQRRFAYFIYANLAACLISCSRCWRSLSPVPSESSLTAAAVRGPSTGSSPCWRDRGAGPVWAPATPAQWRR